MDGVLEGKLDLQEVLREQSLDAIPHALAFTERIEHSCVK
ncbi:hypothetical protein BN1843_29050 [Escherichia coli]|nr:hypothetical protein BN1843_29050 [Escherichia coli]